MSSSIDRPEAAGSDSRLTPQQQEMLARQDAAQMRTQLFQTESQEITERGKSYQAAHDAMLAIINAISGR